ncbi:hypothetical protein AGMMS50225_24220 [Betaproteobacteria bacterium]|nr:hypothetical protein AGMMS50225_24220 [Betaproteobacteria bacterium]
MTYSDIINLWKESKEMWQSYQFAVGGVGQAIYSYFVDKLSIDSKGKERIIKMIPPTEKNEEKIRNTLYAPFACVELKDDGWSEVGLVLLLEYSETAWPKQQYRFVICIRSGADNWMVKMAKDGPVFKLSNECKSEEIEVLWGEFERLIRFQTVDSLNNWLGIKNECSLCNINNY